MPRSKKRPAAVKKLARERAELERRGVVKKRGAARRYYDPGARPFPRSYASNAPPQK